MKEWTSSGYVAARRRAVAPPIEKPMILGRSSLSACITPGINHDDIVILFEFFGRTQPRHPILVEAMQEQQYRLVPSSTIVMKPYAIRENIALAPLPRKKLFDMAIVFHNSLRLCI